MALDLFGSTVYSSVIMNLLYRQILSNAFRYSVGMVRFYVGLAKTNRDKRGVWAAQLRVARKHAQDARAVWAELQTDASTTS